jgi:hypothetical protein
MVKPHQSKVDYQVVYTINPIVSIKPNYYDEHRTYVLPQYVSKQKVFLDLMPPKRKERTPAASSKEHERQRQEEAKRVRAQDHQDSPEGDVSLPPGDENTSEEGDGTAQPQESPLHSGRGLSVMARKVKLLKVVEDVREGDLILRDTEGYSNRYASPDCSHSACTSSALVYKMFATN